MGWSETRTASGIAAAFILCNSVAGLLGNIASVQALPAELPLYAGAVFLGGLVGTTFGIKLASPAILKALGVVLVIGGPQDARRLLTTEVAITGIAMAGWPA